MHRPAKAFALHARLKGSRSDPVPDPTDQTHPTDQTRVPYPTHLLPDPAYLPLNAGFRFSRNAAVPSRMSSVDATRPNNVASYWHASANGISTPLLTALMM